jgi:WD40 repeat protein
VRVWRLADGTPAGKPLRGHADSVAELAVGALPDGTTVIVSGGYDDTVRVWRPTAGTPLAPVRTPAFRVLRPTRAAGHHPAVIGRP